ncbi:MAG TPA: hypothetical protein DCZ43_04150 [candidate division Zixibacteria bacterium]|nr:hypothetical protein [candidate division Zixibacteria bacterium]
MAGKLYFLQRIAVIIMFIKSSETDFQEWFSIIFKLFESKEAMVLNNRAPLGLFSCLHFGVI